MLLILSFCKLFPRVRDVSLIAMFQTNESLHGTRKGDLHGMIWMNLFVYDYDLISDLSDLTRSLGV